MTNKHLHIVTHDVPWPADYGGVIDLFYKIKALHAQGINIHLHCFSQGKNSAEELNRYCSSVHYYPRKNSLRNFSLNKPYIVNSRKDDRLIANLKMDDHPVLLEGIHCTYYLDNGLLRNRKIVVRLHNTEFEYYRQLARLEKNFFKKWYYGHESRLLEKFERGLVNDNTVFIAVSQSDAELYRQKFKAEKAHFVPVFLPYSTAAGLEGKGCFCLYHGNLSINENEEAVVWLLQNVFNTVNLPFVIAGKNPSRRLERLIHKNPNTCLVANPTDKELQDMIGKAQVHVLPSLNNTGIKLKLLNAIFNGRHCLVNSAAVNGSALENYCHIANDPETFQLRLKEIYEQLFTTMDIEKRQQLLHTTFNNEINATKVMTFLW